MSLSLSVSLFLSVCLSVSLSLSLSHLEEQLDGAGAPPVRGRMQRRPPHRVSCLAYWFQVGSTAVQAAVGYRQQAVATPDFPEVGKTGRVYGVGEGVGAWKVS